MSKQSESKKAQNYTPTPTLPTCGNCVNFRSDHVLPDWMVIAKKNWGGSPYTVEQHGVEKNLHCGIGGFAVKKMGSCALFALPTEAA